MELAVISGTGLFTPQESISNDELVTSFNQYVENFNHHHRAEIAAGVLEALLPSSVEFIEKASGIKSRYVVDKKGLLNPNIMAPRIPERGNDELSLQAEMAVVAAKQALQSAHKTSDDIDAVIIACSNLQRAYPAVSVEVQNALGIKGFAFDMNVACSSATFGIQTAENMVRTGKARAVLVINPEICTAHLNFRNRDSHFIFGDACTAMVIENKSACQAKHAFEIIDSTLVTNFSNNIRNNFGFLNCTHPEGIGKPDKLFVQEGRKVFKDVVPMVVEMITEHLAKLNLSASDIKMFFLHQANLNMNRLIASKLLGREAEFHEAPVILDEYANTSSAGSVIAFHKYKDKLTKDDMSILCSFGAGYSVGNVVLKRV